MLLTEIFALSALSGVLAAPPLARESFATQLDNTTVPANFTPTGGVDVSSDSPPPIYHTASDFDFQSLNLALNQEYIELDLFHHGLAQFSVEEFEAAGLNADDRFLIEFMADQEVGHAELLSSILGRTCVFTVARALFTYRVQLVRRRFAHIVILSRLSASLSISVKSLLASEKAESTDSCPI